MFAAHQLISELALFGIFQSICGFVGAWFLLNAQSDRLIFYALLMAAISSGTTLVQMIRAIVKFKACRPCISYLYDKDYLKQLFGYVSWKMLGMSCVVLRTHGVPVLANLFYGPLVNAAYSVANRVSIQATSLSSAMMGAFQPALTSAEGKGDRQKMLAMAMQASKFGTLLILFFVIPLTLEMQTVLHLWLVNPPLYADGLCQWMLAILVIDRMTSGSMMAVNALGRIAAYELIQGSVIALSLPLMWLFFHLDMGPVSIGFAVFVSTAIYCAGRLAFSKYLLQLSVSAWIQQVAIPVSLLIAGASAAGLGIMHIFDTGFLRLCLTSAVTTTVTAGIGWFWLLTTIERQHCISLIKGALSRFNPSNKSASIFSSK
jgi:O-antigen/teichoic acid export membrane protein